MRVAAVKKTATAASSSSKWPGTPSPSPPLAGATPEADFDLGSFSPKRKRRPEEEEEEDAGPEDSVEGKALTGDEPPASTPRSPVLGTNLGGFAGGERQEEEPLRATPDMPPLSTTPPRGASPARAPTAEPTRMEEEGANMGAGGSVPATNVGEEGSTCSHLGTDPLSMDQVDIDTIIEEVAKDTEAEATKIAAEEAAKFAAEKVTKYSTA
nr:uncharacterized protein LOC120969315 [Aegilops tauschii subsp. strangulata]